MTNDLRNFDQDSALPQSDSGKLHWEAPRIETVEGRVAGGNFSFSNGTDGTYYS